MHQMWPRHHAVERSYQGHAWRYRTTAEYFTSSPQQSLVCRDRLFRTKYNKRVPRNVQHCRALRYALNRVPSHECVSAHGTAHALTLAQKLAAAALHPDEPNWERQTPPMEAWDSPLHSVAPSQKLSSSSPFKQWGGWAEGAQVAAMQAGVCLHCNSEIASLQPGIRSPGWQSCASYCLPVRHGMCWCTGSCMCRCCAQATAAHIFFCMCMSLLMLCTRRGATDLARG